MKKVIFLLLAFFISFSAFAQTHILVLGDSLSEGIGLNAEEAFPKVMEKKLKEKKYDVKVTNGGISGSTTASGLSRLKWHLKQNIDILILELGANDGLRGIDLKQTHKNLEEIIKIAKEKKIKVLLLGVLMPPNYGKKYVSDFEEMFQKIAKEQSVPFLPFLLEGVAGVKDMNLADGIHPNAKGQERVAELVTKFVEKHL